MVEETLGGIIFIRAHRMGRNYRNMTLGKFDSRLQRSYVFWTAGTAVNALKFVHMFVQGSHAFTMFPPTRYVMGGATRAHIIATTFT
jgi:hypothetical protein